MKLKKLPFALFTALSAFTLLVGCAGEDGENGTDGTNTATQIISLSEQGRYESGVFDESAAEIVTYDETTQQTFVVNANSGQIDVLDSSDITNPTLNVSLDLAQDLADNAVVADASDVGAANSVTTFNGLMAVAVEADTKTDAGWVLFYKTADLSFVSSVEVGALPDMVTFTPDGSQVVVACEAEPTEGTYDIDPEGTVSVIDVTWDGTDLTTAATSIGFTDFNAGEARNAELPENLLLNGYQASVAEDLEPEYITVSEDSSTAFIGLQENNAVVEIDLAAKTVTSISALGFKDHSIPGNELDGNNKDDQVAIKTEPAFGMYMPDSIASMTYNGKTYLLTANEGDDRDDWIEGLSQTNCEASNFYWNIEDAVCGDSITMKDALDSDVYEPADPSTKLDFSNFDGGVLDSAVKRVKFSHSMTKQFGDIDDDGAIDKMLTYGARSFSIWDTENNTLVFDSGSDFERITAQRYGANFNNDNAENAAEDRSDNKGPEPEALTVGKINGHTYAFIGLERMGGIMVYDVSNPNNPDFVEYINNRDVTVDNDTLEAGGAGDLGPEGFKFVDADNSPSGKPMLIVGSEVSGTTTFYNIEINLLD
ncbi:MAG: choice-of-anchor I family protein [Pseudomonadota bacterium]|nr:choice-of-anchor I family protein [Pseudomonadota bacterium]